MKSSTLIDSIAFQLTPTRTRCDLVITANGKTEKIASGLLDPFLAHLKAAQEQIEKGGYSIVLSPNRESDTPWFTKGTVERFVRFVSTPEILERVYTIESEILQIEKAISLQRSNVISLHNAVDLPVKSEESFEGSQPGLSSNEEKAIVVYQPASHHAEEDGSTIPEKNSKVQLVEVLETRKSVLQKEQGMAFARAVAASFDIDNIATLLVFAECFGASRMMNACKKFVHLWKAKHESGQWVEVEATEAMSCSSYVPYTNAAGIVFHGSNESVQGEVAAERSGKSGEDHQSQQHPMFAPWQMNSQSNGLPIFHPYPGTPYYQNNPGNMFFQPPYPPLDDPRLHPGQRTRQRRHSMDNGDLSAKSETPDDVSSDEDVPVTKKGRNKGGKSSKKQSKTVVIRNINYIASAKQGFGDSDPQSCSYSSSDDNETRKSSKKGVPQMSDHPLKSIAGNDGHWQAFENFLLTDADESSNTVNSMFEMEGKVQGRKKKTTIGDSSYALRTHSMGGNDDAGFHDRFDMSGDTTQRRASRRPGDTDMDYIFNRQEKLKDLPDSSLDRVISNGFQGLANNNNRGLSHAVTDESFVVLHRTGSLDQVAGNGRVAMDMDADYQHPSVLQKAGNHTAGSIQSNYEPNDLNLMPKRVMEEEQSGFDPAIDYEMEVQGKETTQESGKSKKVASGTKQGLKKIVKDQKLKTERTTASIRRGKPSKLSPLEDARARAEKLRAFKVDLQKLKKEKEEEQLKRLEALKIERQKRIAAKSGQTVLQSPSSSLQARKQLPKRSPVSQKGSKFSDIELKSSSPSQRSILKLVPKDLSNSSKSSRPGGSTSGGQSSGNRLTRSASSLSVRKEENNGPTQESKATTAGIRRLSEPKSSLHNVSSRKIESAQAVSTNRVAERAKIKKMPIMKKLKNKEKSQKASEEMLSTAPVIPNVSMGISPVPRNGDDITIVEKTVVMLEIEKPAHIMQLDIDQDVGGKSEEGPPIPQPSSPIIVKEVDCEPSSRDGKGHSYTCVNEAEEVSPKLPNVGSTEKPYQAPYARVSFIEDPCMTKADYGKAPSTSFLTEVTDVKVSQAASEKHQGKDSPKGFKRLLMFGKKSSRASESSIDLDKASLDGYVAGDNALIGSSSEGITLKNILIQEESSSAVTTPKKSSRTFSLLSPFKSKSSEKKPAT